MSETPKKRGAPTKFRTRMLNKTIELAAKGKTNKQIAEILDVSESTWYRWLEENAELSEALREGKQWADDLVEAAHFRRAVGFYAPETKAFLVDGQAVKVDIMKFHPPDVGAQKSWLKNRRPEDWRESPPPLDGPVQITLAYKPKSERHAEDPDE